MITSRLSAVAAAGVAALVLTSCSVEEPQAIGIDTLTIAMLGPIDPAQQAFVDRLTELSGGEIDVTVDDEWMPSGDAGSAEEALTKAVLAGDVDLAWVTMRSLSSIGVTGVDSLEAPLLIQTHKQQREVATGLAGEIMLRQLRQTEVEGLALLPGPIQYPIASEAPLLDLADWAGTSVEFVPGSNAGSVAAFTIESFGGSPTAGTGDPVADVVAGTVQAATASPSDLVPGGVSATGPFLTANLPLWPKMSVILINRDVLDRLSARQNGFVDAAVERAQNLAMADPDVATPLNEACNAGGRFGVLTPDQIAAYENAVLPIYDALAKDDEEGDLFEAIEDAVKRNAGSGALTIGAACRWVAPAA